MRNLLKGCVVSLAGALVVSPHALAQTSPQPNRSSSSLYNKLGNETGGPAPRRDLTGFWAGLVVPKLNEVPPLTPWGQEQFRLHKSTWEFSVAESNDPVKSCDPLGFPRNMLFMTRGIAFTQMPGRLLQLFQYDRLWREIWTDGRELPKNVGGNSADSPDPRWYGDSIGNWEGGYTWRAGRGGGVATKEPGAVPTVIRIASICVCRNATRPWNITTWKLPSRSTIRRRTRSLL